MQLRKNNMRSVVQFQPWQSIGKDLANIHHAQIFHVLPK
jgi:hypothetical protein